jgi:hypothetical protein
MDDADVMNATRALRHKQKKRLTEYMPAYGGHLLINHLHDSHLTCPSQCKALTPQKCPKEWACDGTALPSQTPLQGQM